MKTMASATLALIFLASGGTANVQLDMVPQPAVL